MLTGSDGSVAGLAAEQALQAELARKLGMKKGRGLKEVGDGLDDLVLGGEWLIGELGGLKLRGSLECGARACA